MTRQPLIGCATYHKVADQDPPIEVIGLMPSYVRAVQRAGGLPVLIPLGLTTGELAALLERLDGILIPGGGDVNPRQYRGNEAHASIRDIDEERDQAEIFLAREAVRREMPLLAICRGHQVLNVALGGTLWEDIQSEMPSPIVHDYYNQHARHFLAHEVSLQPGSKLATVLQLDTVAVNSLHHQGIRDLAPELTASGMAPDQLIEGVEIPSHPFAVGVQWHPENLLDVAPHMLALFSGLVEAARNNHV